MNETVSSSGREQATWAYELNDGVPVSASLHRVEANPSSSAVGAPSSRVPFGDVTRNFAEFYAPFLDSTANADLKSPDKIRRAGSSRFSPNRAPGSGAAKRLLWSKDLPPLPPSACQEQAGSRADESAARDASPTRHTLRATSATEARGAPPMHSSDSAGGSGVGADLIRSLSIAGAGTAAGQRWPLAHRGLFGGGASGSSILDGDHGSLRFPLPSELPLQAEAGGLAHPEGAPPEEADENDSDLKKQPSGMVILASAGILGCALPR